MENEDSTLWLRLTVDHSVASHINNKQTTTDNPRLKQFSRPWIVTGQKKLKLAGLLECWDK
jgi:hypothetical protein